MRAPDRLRPASAPFPPQVAAASSCEDPKLANASAAAPRVRAVTANYEWRMGAQTFPPRVGNWGVSRREQGGKIGFSPARRERPAGAASVSGKPGEPADDLVLDHRRRRRHFPNGEGLIERANYTLHPDTDP